MPAHVFIVPNGIPGLYPPTDNLLAYGNAVTFNFAPSHTFAIDLYGFYGNDISFGGYTFALGPNNLGVGNVSLFDTSPFSSATLYADRSAQYYSDPTGAVPEISTFAMLALGALLMLAPMSLRGRTSSEVPASPNV